MNEAYFNECLDKFHSLPDELQEMIGGFNASLVIKKLEDEYQTSLSFATILIAIGELNIDDLSEYLLLKSNIDKRKGEEIADKLEAEIFAPVLDAIIADTPDEYINIKGGDEDAKDQFGPITNLSVSEKRELILKTFTGEIIPALKANPNKLQDFNIAIFQAFNADEDLEDKVETLLYNNQEKLSDHHIILDGHPASPTIANWLKDFIKKYGSDLFNEVSLAEYLSQAPNVRQLKSEEKELVRKVLKLYRNLVFFPESMEGVPLENWEIFPINRALLRSVEPVKSKITNESVPLDSAALEKQKAIFDLQKSLSKYPVTSLEYKAISQEINRLSKK
jgi:hypothetical protein